MLQEGSLMAPSSADVATMGAWDAVETRDRIRKKEVSIQEVLEAAIARAEEAQHLGAVFEPTYARARASVESRDCEAPLAGVPAFVKDLARIRGVPTTWGSRAAGRYVPRRSDPIVTHLEETGVVILGKSACPELGLSPTTEPLGRPPCRNPWAPSRSSGGSSGGSACLVAAGVVPIAHGSDGGGSIRLPAAWCGLVGMKPSRFRLDGKGSNLLAVNVVCEGVLTRTVRDTVAFYAALELRRTPKKVVPIGQVAERPAQSLRIGVFVDAPTGTPVSPEVREAVVAAARLCGTLGHAVEEIACPFEGALIDDFLRYFGFLAWLQVRTARLTIHWGFDRSKIEPWTTGFMEFFSREKLAALAAIRRLRRFSGTFADVMKRHDVLISPTVPEPAPPLGHLATDLPFDIEFARVRSSVAFTPIHNAAGAPAISLPLGRSAAGLPIGVQFAAARGHDRILLELALSIEAARPWEAMAPRQPWLRARPSLPSSSKISAGQVDGEVS
jgi:amidase